MEPRSRASQLERVLSGLPRDPKEIPPRARRAAVAVLLHFGAAGESVLLMRRAEREGDRWSGQISLPGGHADPEDADLLATAVREAEEELGLDLGRSAALLGALPVIQARARAQVLEMWIQPLVFGCTERPPLRLGAEASEAFWLPLEPLRAGACDATLDWPEDGPGRTYPCWSYEGRVVWGLTYRMLQGLLAVWDGGSGR